MRRGKALPFMRLFTADYRRDTRHLSPEQHGAYLLMLITYWEQQGPLPEPYAQKASELDDADWNEHRDTLAGFFKIESGLWKHKRVDWELSDIRKTAKKRAEAGKKGGIAKAKASKILASATAGLKPGNAERDVKDEHPTVAVLSKQRFNKRETELIAAREVVWKLESEIADIKAELNGGDS